MTNNYINKLSYMSSPIVQNKVQWGGEVIISSN